mmetsp:Transcript_664/g.1796  ORF Transcript_664/g.1796 Transcript_664/m.1796 type:complete len:84 (-) Transcript_664:482-733(-)
MPRAATDCHSIDAMRVASVLHGCDARCMDVAGSARGAKSHKHCVASAAVKTSAPRLNLQNACSERGDGIFIVLAAGLPRRGSN